MPNFADFNADNDPEGEHDFGLFEIEGNKCLWKIDAYDLALEDDSPNAADPTVTPSALAIMLASEYRTNGSLDEAKGH